MGNLFPKLYPGHLCHKLLSPLGVEARKNTVGQTPASQDLAFPFVYWYNPIPRCCQPEIPGPPDLDSLDNLGQSLMEKGESSCI